MKADGEVADIISVAVFRSDHHHKSYSDCFMGSGRIHLFNDRLAGDADGDGEHEPPAKRDFLNLKDNLQDGAIGNAPSDRHKTDRIPGGVEVIFEKSRCADSGANTCVGVYHIQPTAHDPDGDGCVETTRKIVFGSKDGPGEHASVVGIDSKTQSRNNSKSRCNSGGKTDGGHEPSIAPDGSIGKVTYIAPHKFNCNVIITGIELIGIHNRDDCSGKKDHVSHGNCGECHSVVAVYSDGTDKNVRVAPLCGHHIHVHSRVAVPDGI